MADMKHKSRRTRGTGQIIKPAKCKRYYLRLQMNGQQRMFPLMNPDGTPCTTKADAEKASRNQQKLLQADTLEETALYVQNAKHLKRQSGVLLSKGWETYLKQTTRPDSGDSTLKKYKGMYNTLVKWMSVEYPKKQLVADIDHDIALEFMQSISESGDSNITFNKYLLALRLIFKHLKAPAALDVNPFDDIAKKPIAVVSRKPFTEDQVQAIFNGFDNGFFYETEFEVFAKGGERRRITKRLEFKPMFKEEMHVLLLLCCWTGCRGQDGCLMTWDCIDFEREEVTYIPRKTARRTGYKSVTLPMKKELYEGLLKALEWKKDNRPNENYILPHIAERYARNHTGIQKDVMKIIRCATGEETKASKDRLQGKRKLAANVYSLHSFRHSLASFLINAGVPLAVVTEILGHGNPIVTEHYSHISAESKKSAIKALPSLTTSATQDDGVIDEPLSLQRKAIADALEKADSTVLDEVERLLKDRGLLMDESGSGESCSSCVQLSSSSSKTT